VFSTQDATYHAELKRTMGSPYKKKSVSGLEYHLNDCTHLLVSKMNDIIDSGKSASVDMASWLQYYAFDSFGAVNFSKMLGFVDAGKGVDGI
ncbi:hypothetical protein GQ44DRAFT_581812, partial [Phaeosphaeriaceae sp. PMI808]